MGKNDKEDSFSWSDFGVKKHMTVHIFDSNSPNMNGITQNTA